MDNYTMDEQKLFELLSRLCASSENEAVENIDEL